ncbi:MAG: hypothetical protein U0836_18260 [Pirellulales bacterium]
MRAAVFALAISLLIGIAWAALEGQSGRPTGPIAAAPVQADQPSAEEDAEARTKAFLERMGTPLQGFEAFTVTATAQANEGVPAPTTSDLQTLVELKLRQAGILVADFTPGSTYLKSLPPDKPRPRVAHLKVTAVVVSGPAIGAFAIQAEVSSILNDEYGKWFPAAAWQSALEVRTCAVAELRNSIRDSFNSNTDEFLNAYLAANPKVRE